MKWSKLKKTIEDKFADSLKGRVNLFATRYTSGSYFMVRGWITIDGEEIANFSTPDNYSKFGWDTPEIDERIPFKERKENVAAEKGEFSRSDFLNACWDYLNMNIDDALQSKNPIIKSLAVLDKRLGKRRLLKMEKTNLHPLAVKMLELRIDCEKLSSRKNSELPDHS
jgi:hypothetical protein